MGKAFKRLPADVWVILPAYNEARYVGGVLKKVTQYTPNCIVVDDGSSDATTKIASRYTDHVLSHAFNLGKGAAMLTGCEYAFEHQGAKRVVFMDSDSQHNIDELPLFVSSLSSKKPVMFGARSMSDDMPLVRKIGNMSLSLWIFLLYGRWVPDVLSGYRAIDSSVFSEIRWSSTRYGVEAEMVARILKQGLPFELVPITTIYHDYKRGMTLLDAVELYWQLLVWRVLV